MGAVAAALSGAQSVLDCTLGGGGHALALLESGKQVTGVDRDPDALAVASERLLMYAERGLFRGVLGDFTRLPEVEELQGASFDGILADLGVSSWQLNEDARGFSFRRGVPLDMRMSGTGPTAADFLNAGDAAELEHVFRDYGDEARARRLAAEVTRRRARHPLTLSDDLVDAIRGALGPGSGPGDFARIFQAVRIAVNEELPGLERALPDLRDRLSPGGILAVIAYHSGEDRLVKHAMRDWARDCHCPPRQPLCTCAGTSLGRMITRRAIVAEPAEVESNARARSARLRVWRKNG